MGQFEKKVKKVKIDFSQISENCPVRIIYVTVVID